MIRSSEKALFAIALLLSQVGAWRHVRQEVSLKDSSMQRVSSSMFDDMKVSELVRHAREVANHEDLKIAMDAENQTSALIELIELSTMKPSELWQHALDLGASQEDLDDAFDAKDQRSTFIQLIGKLEDSASALNSASPSLTQAACQRGEVFCQGFSQEGCNPVCNELNEFLSKQRLVKDSSLMKARVQLEGGLWMVKIEGEVSLPDMAVLVFQGFELEVGSANIYVHAGSGFDEYLVKPTNGTGIKNLMEFSGVKLNPAKLTGTTTGSASQPSEVAVALTKDRLRKTSNGLETSREGSVTKVTVSIKFPVPKGKSGTIKGFALSVRDGRVWVAPGNSPALQGLAISERMGG